MLCSAGAGTQIANAVQLLPDRCLCCDLVWLRLLGFRCAQPVQQEICTAQQGMGSMDISNCDYYDLT